MKSNLLFAGIAVAAMGLTSCSSDEPVINNTGNAISFRPSVGTRATETTNANLNEIEVAAFLDSATYFPTLEFTKGSDNFFTSATTYNWPGDNSTLKFYSFAPENPGGTITMTPSVQTLTGFSPAQNIGSQVDFITAVASGNRAANEASGVPLTFDHRLSQIVIQAKTDNDAYTYSVTGIRVGYPVSKGDFNFADNSWTLASDKAIYEDTYSTPITLGSNAVSIMGNGGALMLIPQQLTPWNPQTDSLNTAQGAYISLKLQINTKAGAQVYPFVSNSDCDWAAIPDDTKWEPGKRYVYTLDLTHGAGYVDPHDPHPGTPVLGGPIKFTVKVTDWVNSDQDLPMDTH
ncbi:MAG: fimbrillin family protein [Bacteroidales bacterium]|nr:fimbrillin family protein [Bacteroidales bacterium]